MKKAAQLLKRRLTNVMTFFKHRITNATAGGLNSKIHVVQNRARGFRNKQNFKIAVFFHCGGLGPLPGDPLHSRMNPFFNEQFDYHADFDAVMTRGRNIRKGHAVMTRGRNIRRDRHDL